MNSKAIDRAVLEIGDLAQVTRTHCGHDEWLGYTFVVTGFSTGYGFCEACRKPIGHGTYPTDEHGRPWAHVKRIPPLGEMEEEQREEEVTA